MKFNLKKARGICKQATQGPWKTIGSEMDCNHIGDCPKGKYDYDDDCVNCEDNYYITGAWLDGPNWIEAGDYNYFTDNDAEFIAFARTALPAALDEIERLQKENAELKKALAEWEKLNAK